MNTKMKVFKGIKIMFGIAFFVTLFGFGTMHLWNWLVPELFHGPVINFCQTIGLIVLSKILFGGMKGGGWGRKGHCGNNKRQYWKERMQERFEAMSPEEKEKFRNKCGGKFWSEKEEGTKGNVQTA